MKKKKYRFVGRKSPAGKFKIPYGEVVELVKWFPRRKVLVVYKGELILTMGYLLRKLPQKKQNPNLFLCG